MRVASLQLGVGAFCGALGALMLVAPHQFAPAAYALLLPLLSLWGVLFMTAGACLVGLVVLEGGWHRAVFAHAAAATVLLALALSLAAVFFVSGLAFYVPLAVGTLLAPWLARARPPDDRTPSIDLLSVVLGIGAICNGLLLLLVPALYAVPTYALMRPYLPLYGAAFLVGGLALVSTLVPRTPPVFGLVGRAVTAVAFGAVLFASSLPNRTWTGIVFYGGFGLLLLFGPWLGPRLRARVDPRSLPTRFGLALAAAAAIPVIALVALSADREEAAARASALARQQDEATLVARSVADNISLHQAGLMGLAAVPDLLTAPRATQDALLAEVNAAYPDVFAIQLADATGRPIARSDGRPLEPVAELPTFVEARRTTGPVVAELLSPATSTPIFSLGAPVTTPGGQFAGFLSADVEPHRIAEMISRSGPDQDQLVYLVDVDGRVLAHPDGALVTTDASTEPPVRALRAGRAGTLEFVAADGPQLAAYAPIERLGWGVVDQRSAASVLGPVWARRDAAFVLLLPLIGLAAIAGALAARWLSSPLLALTGAISEFGEGTAAAAIPPTGIREISVLREVLRDSDERLQLALTAGQMGLWELDLTTWQMTCSDTCKANFGVAPSAELTYPQLLDLVVVEDRAAMQAALTAAVASHTDYAADYRITLSAGDERWIAARGRPSYGADGQPRRMLGTTQDITARKQVEAELARLLVAEQVARAQAEDAVRVREEFLSIASHELRNPIAGIKGHAELLLRTYERGTLDEARLERYLRNMVSGTGRLATLTDDLLDVSRLRAGSMPLRRRTIELTALLDECTRDMAEQHPDRELLWRAPQPTSELLVDVDPDRLLQVLRNVIDNALKYSPGAEPVSISLRTDAAVATIEVTDRGIGLPADAAERIFEPFGRAANASASQLPGLGLGLYICRQIVVALGGQITATSPGEGLGTTVTIVLPLDDEASAETAPSA